ncbi:MAG TPA: hypothetical protein VJB34_02055 [Bdellovibrionota bacterium]|nr:hypothetical protein [Bdellovibrionota bacterium]
MKNLTLASFFVFLALTSISCGGGGGSGSTGTAATFNNQSLDSFTGLPSEVVEQFEEKVRGKGFEEIYRYAESRGIDIIVTQVEESQYDGVSYFNIPDQFIKKNEELNTYFKNYLETQDAAAYFDSTPDEGFTTKPAIYIKKNPTADTVYHEMIHALEFLNSSSHFKSEYFSKFVDHEKLRETLIPLLEKIYVLEGQHYSSSRKKYSLTLLEFAMTSLFERYLSDRQHIFLTKYLFDTTQNHYERFWNLSFIQNYLRELKTPEHLINNGFLRGKKIYDLIESTIRDFENCTSIEERTQYKFDHIKKGIKADIAAIQAESKNLISAFEAWSIPQSFELIRYR